MLTILRPTTTNIWLPSGNPMIYTITESEWMGSDLMALINVYVNDTLVTRLKYPLTVGESLYVDIHDVVHNSLKSTFVNETAELVSPTSEWAKYAIGVCEQYFDNNGEQHITGEAVAPANYTWFASAPFEYDRAVDSFIKVFEPSSSNVMHPLACKTMFSTLPALWVNRTERRLNPTAIDKAYTLKPNTRQTETFCFNDGTNRYANFLVIYVFGKDKPHMLIKKFILDVTSIPTTQAWKFASMPVGVIELNNITWTNVIKKSESLESYIDPATDGFYCVVWCHTAAQNIQQGDVPVSTYTLFALDTCQKDEYRILYKSRDGGWWEIRTHLKHYKDVEVKSSVMTNRFYQTPSVDMRYRKAVGVKATSTMTLNTDWLSRCGVAEVEDALLSPDIWIIKNEQYIPATLTDASYTINDVRQDRLVSYTLTFDIEAPNTLR